MTKRIFSVIIALMILLALLASCSGKSGGNETGEKDTGKDTSDVSFDKETDKEHDTEVGGGESEKEDNGEGEPDHGADDEGEDQNGNNVGVDDPAGNDNGNGDETSDESELNTDLENGDMDHGTGEGDDVDGDDVSSAERVLDFVSNEDGTCYVSGIGSIKDSRVVIPAISPDGDTVVSIGESAFEGLDFICEVLLPDGLVSIEKNAFSGCCNLSYAVIPDTVKQIGEMAFYECAELKSVTLGAELSDIGNWAFRGCYKLVEVIDFSEALSITVGESENGHVAYFAIGVHGEESRIITSEGFVFYVDNENVWLIDSDNVSGSIILPETVDELSYNIHDYAFYGNQSITEVVIPNGIRSVGIFAFSQCMRLMSVELGEDVEDIKENAFAECPKLIEVINCSALDIKVGEDTFGQIAYYAKGVHDDESRIYDRDGYLFCNMNGVKYLLGYVGEESDLVLPSDNGGDYEIYAYAFYGMDGIRSVHIPADVTAIGADAFGNCTSLASITVGYGVRFIGSDAFSNCSSFESLQIMDVAAWCAIEFEDAYANPMRFAKKLYVDGALTKAIVVPEGVTVISDYAFYGFKGLMGIKLPESLTNIGEYAFYNCTGLMSISIPSNMVKIDDFAFNGCYKLIEVINHSGLGISEGDDKFGNVALYAKEVHGGESRLVDLDGYLFYSCGGVNYLMGALNVGETLDLAEGYNGQVYEIYRYAFYDRDGIVVVNIPEQVTRIGENAFFGCDALTSVTIASAATSIGEYAFYECDNLSGITIGAIMGGS